ncbi:hypothetical protein [Paenibacillus sp. Soil787]|uniref:hypothetical protein n=1 Tax=Paenibacillus sp. Soil787 TaxID=1736411 RepID=UPI000702C30D|nr:hypothetical protein [Paenibacillus sp. Soil787]KRF27660.1 hypothetical protein ASG93_29395 [Paenibacillus sp. Soil787]
MKQLNREHLLLENGQVWKEMMMFDPDTGEKNIIARPEPNVKIQGHYEQTNGYLILLYKKDNKLYFQADDEKICLSDTNCKITLVREDHHNHFSILQNENIVFTVTYTSWQYDELNLVDPSFNDDMEESQDIYLFMYNLMQDKERQQRIYS